MAWLQLKGRDRVAHWYKPLAAHVYTQASFRQFIGRACDRGWWRESLLVKPAKNARHCKRCEARRG